jgi:general secretion pathway protein E
MRPPLDIRVPRRVSLDDLVDALVTRGLVREERAALVRREADLRRASLARAKTETAKLAGVAMPTDVSPVEVVLSFNEPADAPPLREDVVTELWAELLGMPYVKLDPLELDPAFAMRIVSKPFARKNGYLAIDEQDGVVRIATHRPLDRSGVESIERMVRKKVALVVASQTDVERLITEFYGFRQSVKRAEQQISTSFELGNLEQLVRMKSDAEIESSDQHVVHAVDYMFRYAFGQRASDIHIEPKRNESLVRYRIDGALHTVNRIPRVVHNAIVNRIKTLSRLDIAEKRKPQDGRRSRLDHGRAIDLRVSTLPVAFGEKVVIAHLRSTATVRTGSRRSASRRSAPHQDGHHASVRDDARSRARPARQVDDALLVRAELYSEDPINFVTVEDPVEYQLEGINQVPVNPKRWRHVRGRAALDPAPGPRHHPDR